jgi:uncharacterized membrane protein
MEIKGQVGCKVGFFLYMKGFVTRLQPFIVIIFQYFNILIKVSNKRNLYSEFKNVFFGLTCPIMHLRPKV